uniref:Uncharacterized protein n=1 Tax=Panagrolaimus davidi TaxID=227884 RepID=A0A914QY72_9BILA
MTIPLIFLVIPITFLLIVVAVGNGDIAELSQWVLQFFGIHSSGNAVAIMIIFKPYRSRIIQWIKNIKRFVLRQPLATVENLAPLSQITSSGILPRN